MGSSHQDYLAGMEGEVGKGGKQTKQCRCEKFREERNHRDCGRARETLNPIGIVKVQLLSKEAIPELS